MAEPGVAKIIDCTTTACRRCRSAFPTATLAIDGVSPGTCACEPVAAVHDVVRERATHGDQGTVCRQIDGRAIRGRAIEKTDVRENEGDSRIHEKESDRICRACFSDTADADAMPCSIQRDGIPPARTVRSGFGRMTKEDRVSELNDSVAIKGDNSVPFIFTRLENSGFQLRLSADLNLGLSVSRRDGEGCPSKKNQQDDPTRRQVFQAAHDGALT